MTPELLVLALSVLLWAALLAVGGTAACRQVGTDYLMGPRDEPKPPTGRVARIKRALDNHVEGLVLYTAATVVVVLAGKAGAFTAACAYIYLAARILYIPAYAYGWTPGRSLIWAAGFLATLAMIVAALVG